MIKKKIRTHKNRIKTPKRSKLIIECDKLVSKIVRLRDPYCVICGSTDRLQCSHLIKRGKHATRFDLTNCNTNCASCNYRHNNYPEFYTSWWLEKYGIEAYNELIAKSKEQKKWTIPELLELKSYLTKLLDTYL